MSRVKGRTMTAPRDLDALESDDGELAILSFALPEGSSALTPAESEVAHALLAGRSNAQIAAIRGASERTVANQVASLFRKLGIHSRLELVAMAPLAGTPEPHHDARPPSRSAGPHKT